MMLFLLLGLYIDNSLRLSTGIIGNGMGGMMVLMDEGFSVFQNPAINYETRFNFVLGRWFYRTDNLTFGVSHKNNAIGIYYLNYGEVQGYDEYGIPTNKFTPYDMNIGYARRFGLFGICIKNFQTRVDTILFTGVVGGIGSYITLNKLAIGAKIDNIGAELIHRVDVPAMMGIALRYSLLDDFKIFAEIRGKNFEISSGLLYKYEMLQIFAGAKYIRPEEYIERSSFSDCWFSGGVVVGFDEYEIGYSFVYTEFSNAHQIGIKLTPDLSSKKLF